MDEKNELNDIILDKNGSSNKNKKVIFAAATFGVVLIAVVLIMSSMSSNDTQNLPQANLPEVENTNYLAEDNTNEDTTDPLFEEVEVVEEDTNNDDNLDMIAQKLKQESQKKSNMIQDMEEEEEVVVIDKPKPTVKHEPKKVVKQVVKKEHKTATKSVAKKEKATPHYYYVQVGSFSKYKPNKKFLKSITDNGFKYKYHKVNINSKTINKILIGPFKSEKDARVALKTIRKKIEAGAFLTNK